MTKRMTDIELDRFKQHLVTISESGTESEVRAYINEHFPRLPEAMQSEILAGLWLTTLREEIAELQNDAKSE